MINLKEFLKTFKGTDFKEEELKIFYRSVKKSIILQYFGKRALPELFNLEEKCQWPILQRLDNPELSIYRNADRTLLNRFIKNIKEEKALREEKDKTDKYKYWSGLKSIIEDRLELFKDIFDFYDRDIKRCEMAAERYRRMRERRIENRKKLWKFGIGAGATALAGAAAIWYLSKKEKK
ncbi:MAG: hypothetical protein M1610_00640 [Nitrospirae bacterium]|nr:hypothetical protein [Nitrospirota bacterium]MDA8214990.1 hypothetical protein [Nitrospiraceae bacterium]MDA8340122.1 hypothetical protein [Nitrospiraceae bacterium]